MLRAFSTLGCADLSLDEILALAEAHAIDGVELRAVAGRLDLPAYFAETYGTPKKMAAELGLRAAQVLSLSTSLKLAEPSAADRAEFLAFVPWAEALGVDWLRVFDGGAPGAEGALVETLDWWERERTRRGWRCEVMIETHDTLFTAQAINSLCARRPGTAILWDAFNTWLKGGEDPLATWREIQSHVAHLHLKDAIRKPSDQFPWTYVLPGRGGFPFRRLIEQVRGDGYMGHASLEWERLWHPYLGSLELALVAAEGEGWR